MVKTADFLVQADDSKSKCANLCLLRVRVQLNVTAFIFFKFLLLPGSKPTTQIGQIYLCQLQQRKAAANEFRTTYEHTRACKLREIILN